MKKKYVFVLSFTVLTFFITSCTNSTNQNVQAYANNISPTMQAKAPANFQVVNQPSPDSDQLTVNYIHENKDNYLISVKYPATSYPMINKIIEDSLYPYINRYKEIIKNTTVYTDKLEFLIDYETIKYNNSITTFKFNIHNSIATEKKTTVIKTLTFNLDNGKNISLENLFKPNTNYLDVLSQKANKHLNKNVAPIAESFSNFALSEKNLILYFDINGANEQTDTLNIPYSDLSNMLLAFNDIGILPEPITPAKTPTEAATEAPPTAPTETIIATQATTEAIVQTPSSSETPQVQAQAETTKPAPICADNLIAITFDDGPNPKTTPILLDGLKERNVKATFFTLGINMENNPDIITRMHDEGHLIANHSYNHQNLVKLDYDDMEKQYNTPNTILNSIIGTNTTLFRPPYGNYNDCVKQISNTPIILWSIDPKDWKYRNADTVSNHIIERAKDGDIILLHDIHPTSVQAALQTIDALKEKGFTFVTVDELIRRDGYEPQPGEIFGCKRKD